MFTQLLLPRLNLSFIFFFPFSSKSRGAAPPAQQAYLVVYIVYGTIGNHDL